MEVIKDDYIRKIEAVKILQKAYTEGRIKAKDGCISVLDDINALPKADVQPIVHCKDCKYRKEWHYEENGEKPYIKYECKFTKYSMSGDGFCSFGARMDGDAK